LGFLSANSLGFIPFFNVFGLSFLLVGVAALVATGHGYSSQQIQMGDIRRIGASQLIFP
jgi:hypothetical protein